MENLPVQWSSLSRSIEEGTVSARQVIDESIDRATDQQGEGQRAFTAIYKQSAGMAADAQDGLRGAGYRPSLLAGMPISVKDNIAIQGEITAAGSKRLAGTTAPARMDANVVQKLKAAGAIVVGRTNMSELAFSGVGINPHFGTPANPYDRNEGRIPGGSTSGGAISVTDRMAIAAIGTDTGGSLRIPAALCGLVGFKPTQERLSRNGVVPLSPSLDCVGSIANSVEDCALLDAIMSADGQPDTPLAFNRRPRLATVDRFFMEAVQPSVAQAYDAAVGRLKEAGFDVEAVSSCIFDQIADLHRRGTFPAAEGWAEFGNLLEAGGEPFDPRIQARLERGGMMTARDYLDLQRGRASLVRSAARKFCEFDAIVAPTTPIVAPYLKDMSESDEFNHVNLLLLRNPAVANLLDCPSISIPCHDEGRAPVGLMLIGKKRADQDLFALAARIERAMRDGK